MRISRLKLIGFKSFVEPTELLIEPGLTGVVGPNGCGKSNLLEALRWVMGETSHKSMRAAAMDDVIFAGTSTRPARNMAEVTMVIDNAERQAPAEFNGSDVIEIARRIERDAGSAYRINGREARARDVKILFEDAATGARSPALVRQGQIGELINAKPEARRRILEDAAGTAGLHSRRHEAELRLRAAQANLARLADVVGGLTTQLDGLKRQARQARRYREISEEIRRNEALALYLRWRDAHAQVETDEAALGEALIRLGEAVRAEAQALAAEADCAARLEPLREAAMIRSAVFGRLKVEADVFEREAERQTKRAAELAERAVELERDLARESELQRESDSVIARLDEEAARLASEEEGAGAAHDEAEARAALAAAELAGVEARLAELTGRVADARARHASLQAGAADRQGTAQRLAAQLIELQSQIAQANARLPDALEADALATAAQDLTLKIEALEYALTDQESALEEAGDAVASSREAAAQARLELTRLATERRTLTRLLVPALSGTSAAVADSMTVQRGYEAALGAVLGDDLDAPADTASPIHWRCVAGTDGDWPGDPKLPEGVTLLAQFIEGPPELTRRLKQVGVVDAARGPDLQQRLATGQVLVSRDGALWRWDGFVSGAGALTAAAQRLELKNSIAAIEQEEADAAATLDVRESRARTAAENQTRIEAEVAALRRSLKDTAARLVQVREDASRHERVRREAESRLSVLADAQARVADEVQMAQAAADDAARQLADLGTDDLGRLDEELAVLQADARRARESAAERRAEVNQQARVRQERARQVATIAAERARWHLRAAGAGQQLATLSARLAQARAELDHLADLPSQIDERRHALLDGLSRAEQERAEASDKLAVAETALKSAASDLKTAQSDVVARREDRARIEARLEGSRQRRSAEAHAIGETLEVEPDGCLAIAGLSAAADCPMLADVDRLLTRLRSDRERLGGVNLQADDDVTRISAEVARLEAECTDVEQAIAKLRAAIGQLNREGRKRLNAAFETVDGHFQSLFATLFGGGEARLEMIQSDEDPLDGGLEIIAKPPGKKPATLSLLSGGEQTLTALALIFAVFLTNPSPICVLDEVDAPLDDANVDRFCRMMETMAADTATRFLVITHHPMTMTRMDRLFGVTMAERGVSQLVSVDLQTAHGFREAG
ncbi:MAG: chromosome segregation protein SMC [Hyphomicrobiaceae bacterium]|nr:chromosome segregation protein SMC [Hyphomicrobiaceae bacterium]